MQYFQTIARQPGQVCQAGSTVQDLQASLGLCLDSLEAAYPLTVVEGFSVLVTKALDHEESISKHSIMV
jgi:hypothetical protein